MQRNVNRPWPALPPVSKGPYARVKQRLSTPRARRLRTVARRLLLLAVVLTLALAALLYVTRTYSLASRTYPAAVRRLAVDADTGQVTAVGSDRRDSFAFWQRRYSLIKPRVEDVVRGDTLQLRSRCPLVSFRCTVILGAQVPTGTAATIRTDAAAVAVQGLSGPVDITTESGAATVERAAGPVRVTTRSGKVVVAGVQGDLAARTVSSPIELHDVSGGVDLSSGSGLVTGSGRVGRAFAARTGTGWVTVTFQAPPERIDVHSASGQIDLELPHGRYRLGLAAPAGQVHLHGITDDPTATRTITISTGGGIVLTGT